MTANEQEKIKALEQEIARLERLVYVDELTGVMNRKGVHEVVEPLFKEALFRKHHPDAKRKLRIDDVAVLFIDVDNFKSINDTHGHQVGDEVLREIGYVLKEDTRSIDIVGRYGGEEFIIVLIGANENQGHKKGEGIRQALSEEVKPPSQKELTVTASIGVAALSDTDVASFDDLVLYADKAMYEAKTTRGKNTVVSYSELKESNLSR